MYNSIWYQNLIKPPFTPPDWVFAPAWIVLYITIFAALLIYIIKKTTKDKSYGYIFFFLQILLNILWPPTFFISQNMLLALLIIILLDIFTFITICKFYNISKPAAILLIPYLLWIIFATYLNTGYIIAN